MVQVIDNIQIELVFVKLAICIAKPTQHVVVVTKSSQPIQHVVEPI
jgi:hypothetical protein